MHHLQWHHNEHDGVSNHQPSDCLLNRLFRRESKKTSKLRATGLCEGNHRLRVNSPHKGLVTRKIFPFDDVIMRRTSFVQVMACHRFGAKLLDYLNQRGLIINSPIILKWPHGSRFIWTIYILFMNHWYTDVRCTLYRFPESLSPTTPNPI